MAAVQAAGPDPMMTTFSGIAVSAGRDSGGGPHGPASVLYSIPRPAPRTYAMLRLTDLREILRYVPRFRDRVFVIALDGAVVESENYRNLLLDIALLRSLRINVALVHGAAHQVQRLASLTGQSPSDLEGTGVT